MKISAVLGTLANIAVVVFVVAYFLVGRGEDGSNQADQRFAPVELSDEEWDKLTNGASVLGDASATVEIVEFIDYQCPFCVSSRRPVLEFVRANSESAVAIRHLPIPTHGQARPAAQVAICSESVGHFEEVHDLLLATADWHLEPDWETSLRSVLDAGQVRTVMECVGSGEAEARLDADIALAKEFGVRATPTFMSRTTYFPGAVDRTGLARLMESSR